MKREPRKPWAREGAYTRIDVNATEVEVTRFVADLVRLLAPEVVVETGTYQGDTAVAIAGALWINAERGVPGHLHTFEVDRDRHETASARLLGDTVTPYCHPVTDWTPPAPITLAFIDGGDGDARLHDIAHLHPHMKPGGIMLLHDTMFAVARKRWRPWLRERGYDLVTLPTPRGITIIQHPDWDVPVGT